MESWVQKDSSRVVENTMVERRRRLWEYVWVHAKGLFFRLLGKRRAQELQGHTSFYFIFYFLIFFFFLPRSLVVPRWKPGGGDGEGHDHDWGGKMSLRSQTAG